MSAIGYIDLLRDEMFERSVDTRMIVSSVAAIFLMAVTSAVQAAPIGGAEKPRVYFEAGDVTLAATKNKEATEWDIRVVFAYDALELICLINGDPFYQKYYPEESAQWQSKLDQRTRDSLDSIKKIIKTDGGSIVSATLTLFFSAVNPVTLEDLIYHAQFPEKLEHEFRKSQYWSDENWQEFNSLRADLLIVFDWYEKVSLEEFWQENIRPKLMERKEELEVQLVRFAIQHKVEQLLGRELPDVMTKVYLNYFNKPHGIGLIGNAYITNLDWNLGIVVGNGPHELMHPPYEGERWRILLTAMHVFREDAFLMDKIENHNPDFGYNSFEGYVEENIIQALDQIIAEAGGIARDPVKRWREADGGIHVLAAVLYYLMKTNGFDGTNGGADAFIMRAIKDGKLAPGNIEDTYSRIIMSD